MPACFVAGCKKSSKNSNLQKDGISFHLFPRDSFLRKKWTKICNRPNNWIPKPSSSICSRHFELSQFQLTDCNRRRLKLDAVPTLLLQKDELEMANLTQLKQIFPRTFPKISLKKYKDTSADESQTELEKELEMANLTKSKRNFPRIYSKISLKNYKETEEEESHNELEKTPTTSETAANTDNFNPKKCLQLYLKHLLPHVNDEENAVFVVLVNNEKPASGTNHRKNGKDFISKVFSNAFEEDPSRLRNKLARINRKAERYRKKVHILWQSRRRLMERNQLLMRMIRDLKNSNSGLRSTNSTQNEIVELDDNDDGTSDSESGTMVMEYEYLDSGNDN